MLQPMVNGQLNPLVQNVDRDGLTVGKRVFKLELNEADVLNIDITLIDGTVGNLVINATTLAQIILDRNQRALPVEPEPSTVGEIQVGDGDLPEDVAVPLKIVNADDLLMASKNRLNRMSPTFNQNRTLS